MESIEELRKTLRMLAKRLELEEARREYIKGAIKNIEGIIGVYDREERETSGDTT